MPNLFLSVYQHIRQYKLIAWPTIIAVFAVFAFLANQIDFKEDITDLIPVNDKSETIKKVLQQVSFSDKIVVNISVKEANPEKLTEYADQYIDSLQRQLPDYIDKIQGKVADDTVMELYDFVYQHLPFFLTESDYKLIAKKINSDSITNILNTNYKTLISPAGLVTKKFIVKDPLALTPIGLQKLAQLQLGDNFDLYNGYLITKDQKNILLFITPALSANETRENTFFVDGLESITTILNTAYNNEIKATLFGSTLYAVANAKQIKKDIQLTISIALTILLLILIAFYRKITVPLIIFTPTVFGAIIAIAMLYLIKGQISAISLGIGSVLLGITLDYSLHILTHFRNNRDVTELYRDVAMPVLMSSATTAVAFLCLIFVKSEALQDLGIFAAISVVSASVFALIFIPQVYRSSTKEITEKKTFLDIVSKIGFHQYKVLVAAVVIMCCIGLFLFHKVEFDTDLSAMNYQPDGLVEAETDLDRINNTTASQSIYLVTYGTSLNEALNTNNTVYTLLHKKKEQDALMNYSSIGGIVLSQEKQQEKIRIWNEFWTKQRTDTIIKLLKEKGVVLGFKTKTFTPFYEVLQSDHKTIGFDQYRKVKELYLDEFVSKEDAFSTVVSAIKVHPDHADVLTKELSGIPNMVVIDRKQLNEDLLGNLKNDFNTLIGYSLIAVVFLLLLFYKDTMLTLITVLPIAITWIITLGVMQLLGIKFTIFNVIISTFVFGLGIDYSIFITNGLIKEYTYGSKELPTYKTSILLSVITTILGVGVLIFAKHPALRSIAVVSLIGILAAVLVAFTIQPLLFHILITNRSKKGLAPLQVWQTFWSLVGFGYFISVGFVVSTVCSLIIPWFPIATKKKMSWYHKLTARLMASVLYTNPYLKKKIINSNNEDFSNPSIIIANHTSFLDILAIGRLHPKLIFLVKDWVYKNPVFGKAAKLAGFYPVSSGVEDGITHLKEKIAQGYSLVVFPEGSRADRAKMSRFHKGAFYIAEELNLDIIPVILHGNSQISPKGDFIIREGTICVKILPRVTPENIDFGSSYTERTKKMSRYSKEQYIELQGEIEGVDYYKKAFLNNYRYKTCFTEMKNEFRKQKNVYYRAATFIQPSDKVGMYSDAYGQFLLYLSYKKPYAKLKGILTNPAYLSVAQHCYATHRHKINFVSDQDKNSTEFDVLLLQTASPVAMEHLENLITPNTKRIIVFSEERELVVRIPQNFKVEVEELGITVLNKA
ncbi:MMPL family transporter [Aquimarina addita]|uniref:MMPL family transporter n=1 Tax=Aquimarina addita TaxID=870485 RepID=A0ABP6UKC3_9FLAO